MLKFYIRPCFIEKLWAFFFENFITDRYSILYSHFTVESVGLSQLRFKMYFYDGIVEEKMARLTRHLQKFRSKKYKNHRRLLRRFIKLRPIKLLKVRFLRLWRYYDYLLARQIIFFFIYFLNMGRSNISRSSFINIVR